MRKIMYGQDVRSEIIEGVKKLAKAVKITLGPKGKNVLFTDIYNNPVITKDGVTVANNIVLSEDYQEIGARMVRDIASKTSKEAGDGPQPLYARILTPDGFITMGEVNVGDIINGTNGTIQKVEGVFPKGEKEIYIVKFIDGREVECCEDHLWEVYDSSKSISEVVTVKSMIECNK